MLLLLIWFPFLGFVCGILCSLVLGRKIKHFTTINIYFANLVSFCLILKILFFNAVYNCPIATWLTSNFLTVSYEVHLDLLNALLAFIVTFISFLVHFYSCEYMQNDPHLPRFMTYLSLFTVFMLILITANNFLLMFVGWEGVGLASYLLINFWHTRIQANKAAIKAMLFNRFADIAIILALCLIYSTFGTFDFTLIFNLIFLIEDWSFAIGSLSFPVIELIGFFLFLGAMGKSAQFGFHNWLPDAMEGPTPVSALIHAATMVTAGIFLIARCSYIFELTNFTLTFIAIIGSITALFGATVGFFSNDLKKVIAFSTCSQLGYMMIACGLRQYHIGLFHLSTHAFFKALLFLAAGSIIHAVADDQDVRKMGGLLRYLPLTYICFLIGSLNLMGLPFLGGFFSKDGILEMAFATYTNVGLFCYIIGLISVFFTSAYSIRICIIIFFKNTFMSKKYTFKVYESNDNIRLPLMLLSVVSIISGYFLFDLFCGLGNTLFFTSLYFDINNVIVGDNEFLAANIKILPLIFISLATGCSVYFYLIKPKNFFLFKKNDFIKQFFLFFSKKWYIDRLVNEVLVLNLLNFSKSYSYESLDRGLLEHVGPTWISAEVNHIVHKKDYFLFLV